MENKPKLGHWRWNKDAERWEANVEDIKKTPKNENGYYEIKCPVCKIKFELGCSEKECNFRCERYLGKTEEGCGINLGYRTYGMD